jgi:hypothetical protein
MQNGFLKNESRDTIVKVGNVIIIYIGILLKARQRSYDRRQRRGKASQVRRRHTFFWSTISLIGICLKLRKYRNGSVAVWLRSYKSEYDAINGFVWLTAPNILRVIRLRSTKFTLNSRVNLKSLIQTQNRSLRRLRKKFSL